MSVTDVFLKKNSKNCVILAGKNPDRQFCISSQNQRQIRKKMWSEFCSEIRKQGTVKPVLSGHSKEDKKIGF